MKTFLMAIGVTASLAGCVVHTPTAPAPSGSAPPAVSTLPASTPPSGASVVLTADGKRVAVERTYRGNCAPAGTRGGCHTITLRPDGTYRNFLYDAAIEGTYEIGNGFAVLSAPPGGGQAQQLSFAADGSKLGEMLFSADSSAAP